MDFSKFKTSDWLKVGGGALFLIAGFLPWWKIDTRFGDASGKAFDYFGTAGLAWIIFVAIAVLTFLAVTGTFKLPSSLPAPLIFLGAAAFGLLLTIVRFLSDGVDDGGFGGDFGLSRGIGNFLGLIAAIVVLAGCLLGFKESGGDLNDLKDMDKLKGAFNQGGGSTPPPPPPPPGMTPPPPPPPPAG